VESDRVVLGFKGSGEEKRSDQSLTYEDASHGKIDISL
jgi:hypothetical protein